MNDNDKEGASKTFAGESCCAPPTTTSPYVTDKAASSEIVGISSGMTELPPNAAFIEQAEYAALFTAELHCSCLGRTALEDTI